MRRIAATFKLTTTTKGIAQAGSWVYLETMENYPPPYQPPQHLPHINCRCVLIGLDGKALGLDAEGRRAAMEPWRKPEDLMEEWRGPEDLDQMMRAMDRMMKDLTGSFSEAQQKCEDFGAALDELPDVEGDVVSMECMQRVWDEVLARDGLVPVGVRERVRGAELHMIHGHRVRLLLQDVDAIQLMMHPQWIDDLELALSCELGLAIQMVVEFHD